MHIIYELLFKSFWQILMYVKQELQYNRSDNKTISNMGMISVNNSASTNYSLMCKKKNNSVELSRYHLSLLEARNR
jgi:leucyl-tRNA synthetase